MGVLHNSKARKVGRPREVQGIVRPKTLYIKYSRLGELEELCNENGISLSEGVRQLIEHELSKTP
jgi:hypothetical protein